MKVGKKLIVGSIILLLIITPTLVIAKVNKNTYQSPLNVCDKNCLGTIELRHQPLPPTILKDKGLTTQYNEPTGNPTYDYYFPEDENGYVYLNFTLHVKHLINPVGIYWAKLIWRENYRSSGVIVWINYDGVDYCYNNSVVVCNTTTFREYNLSITYDEPLFTNNSTLKCKFWCSAYPAITPIPFIQLLCSRFLLKDVVVKDIWIHPLL